MWDRDVKDVPARSARRSDKKMKARGGASRKANRTPEWRAYAPHLGGVLAGTISCMLYSLAPFFPPLWAVLGVCCSPLPLFVAMCVVSSDVALMGTAWAAFGVYLQQGGHAVLFFGLLCVLPTLVLLWARESLGNKQRRQTTVPRVSGGTPVSFEMRLGYGMLAVLCGVAVFFTWVVLPLFQSVITSPRQALSTSATLLRMLPFLPAYATFFVASVLFGNMGLAFALVRRMGGDAPRLCLSNWYVPQQLYVFWGVLLTLSLLVTGTYGTLVVTLALVVALAFFIEGCAVLQCFLNRLQAGAFLVPLVVVAGFLAVPAIMLVILGVLEPVMHFRRRFGCG